MKLTGRLSQTQEGSAFLSFEGFGSACTMATHFIRELSWDYSLPVHQFAL